MRRRRKKNNGLRWTFALVVVGALGYVGVQYWKGNLPIKPPGQAAAATVVAQPASVPPPAPVTVAPAASPTATFMSEAEARDAAVRAAREQTLMVQQKLRQANLARSAAADRPADNERCINGQRMKRVDNGWVQTGGLCEGAVAAPEPPPPPPEQQQPEQPQTDQQQPTPTELEGRSAEEG